MELTHHCGTARRALVPAPSLCAALPSPDPQGLVHLGCCGAFQHSLGLLLPRGEHKAWKGFMPRACHFSLQWKMQKLLQYFSVLRCLKMLGAEQHGGAGILLSAGYPALYGLSPHLEIPFLLVTVMVLQLYRWFLWSKWGSDLSLSFGSECQSLPHCLRLMGNGQSCPHRHLSFVELEPAVLEENLKFLGNQARD